MSLLEPIAQSFFKKIIKATIEGNRNILILLTISSILLFSGAIIGIVGSENKLGEPLNSISIILAITGSLGITLISAYQSIQDEIEEKEEIKKAQDKVEKIQINHKLRGI